MTTAIDGAQLALLGNRLAAIVRKMQNTLARSGRSGVLNTARDFSCCLLTAGGDVLMTAQSLPIHVTGGPDLQARAMNELVGSFAAGDAFLHNSPYHGNTHAADHSLLVPVVAGGVHRFTVLAKAHQADCGNSVPTTYMVSARDVYEEGALIFPVVRVQRDYEDCSDVLRMCEMRIRVPEQWHGDYLALLGTVRIGERAVLELGDEIGWESLDSFAEAWLDYSERRMIAAIGALPAGTATTETRHDPVLPAAPGGIVVRATVTTDPIAGFVDVDLTDNVDCLPCGLNLSEASSRAAAMIGVFNSIDHTVPHNQGSFRRIRVHLRENCVVGVPRHPASCSAATTNLANRVGNVVQRAMAELDASIGLAEVGCGFSPSEAVISGVDPRSGGAFVNQLFTGPNGGAGGPRADGWLTMSDLGSGGSLLLDSVEIDELKQPIVIFERRLVADSEGAGEHRGAPSLRVEYGPQGCEIEAVYANDGAINATKGARGGLGGAPSGHSKRGIGGERIEIDAWGPVRIGDGERIVATTSGGGGFGSPLARPVDAVGTDVAEGWISRTRAHDVYGVVLDDDGHVDAGATDALRRRMRGETSK